MPCTALYFEAMAIGVKQQRGAAVEKIRNKAIDALKGSGEGDEEGGCYQVCGCQARILFTLLPPQKKNKKIKQK